MVYSSGKSEVYGGTSAGTPSFAGIVALLNQYLVTTGAQPVAGVGNVNPRLYALAQTAPSAFHDVLQGDNIVAVKCGGRSRGCVSGSYGYPAAPGYDQATGLGSVDAYNLVMAWRGTQTAYTRGAGIGVAVVNGKYRPQRWIRGDHGQGHQRGRWHTEWNGHALRRRIAACFGSPERRRYDIDGKLHGRR